jgi:hypothetical protein
MAAPFNDLESKLEAAMLAVVNTLTLTVAEGEGEIVKNTGLDADAFGIPSVIVSCESTGDETPRDTGNFLCRATVTISTHSSDATLAAHRSRVATVRDAFLDDAIETTLSAAASDFHCFERMRCEMRREIANTADGKNVLRNVLEFEAICCASDIS